MMQKTITIIEHPDPAALLADTGNGAASQKIALVFDERQGCALAHDYLAAHDYALGLPQPGATNLPAYTRCPSYHAGWCGGNGCRDHCLFEEQATSPGWTRARYWRLLPSGALCPADSYAEHLADERAWPTAKPWADAVARSFEIATDGDGAVLDERTISTTAEDLRQGLAWALALGGLDEREIPEIMAVWAPEADLDDPYAPLNLPASMIYGALSTAALRGVRLAEAEALLQEVRP